jgi:hypothetical protein
MLFAFYSFCDPLCFPVLHYTHLELFSVHYFNRMTSLMIPSAYLDSVNCRLTDNTMVKRKSTKRQTTIYKALHRNLRIEQRVPHYTSGVNSCTPEG